MLKQNIFNRVMLNGNKHTSENLVYKSLKKLQKTNKKKNFKEVLIVGLINSSPIVFLKHIKRKRKRNIEFPFLLAIKNRTSYGIKFIITQSNKSKQESFYKKFALELLDSSKSISQTVKKKKSFHQEAFLKKKFSNYRWF